MAQLRGFFNSDYFRVEIIFLFLHSKRNQFPCDKTLHKFGSLKEAQHVFCILTTAECKQFFDR